MGGAKYSTPISLAGGALVLAGGLAWLLQQESGWLPLVNVALGVAGVVVAAVINPDLFRQYGRWINAFWGGIMVLAIVVMVNFLADRYQARLDMTEGQLHSLADLTVETLEGLEVEVRALAFMEAGKNEALEGLLEQYAIHSGHFNFEVIDLDRDGERASEYEIRSYNTLVIQSGERQQKLTEYTEKEITNAVLKVVRDRDQRVYFTVGHGERGVDEGEQTFSHLRERLEEIAYTVEDSVLLVRRDEVPDDCSVLIVAGASFPFLETEVAAVRRYLQRGGAVLLLADPAYETGLAGLLREWGVSLGDDFVIDRTGSLFGVDDAIPVATRYHGEHPIVRKHRQSGISVMALFGAGTGVMTVFELARSVRLDDELPPSLEGAELVLTSSQSWAETDFSEREFDEGLDVAGPISLGVAVRAKGDANSAKGDANTGGRLVVFGDSDFATNRYFESNGNGDLALNAVSWLAADEDLISIRPKAAGYNPIALTERDSEWIFWMSVVLYPCIIAFIGFAVVSRKGRWSGRDLAAAGLGVILSAGVVGLVNFAGERYRVRYDFTEEGLYTLHPDSMNLLETIDDGNHHVAVKTFMAQAEGRQFQEIMDQFRSVTRNFEYEIVDPMKRALEVKQHGIRERFTSVIELTAEGKVQSRRITELTEEALSNAILMALKSKGQSLTFVGGHGEGRLTEVGDEGFSVLNSHLKQMAFQIEEDVRLDDEDELADAEIVAILAPQSPLTEVDVKALAEFLKRGKDAVLLLDPGVSTGLESLLEDEYGVAVGNDLIIDPTDIGRQLGGAQAVVISYGDHPIAEQIPTGTMSIFPQARSVSRADHTPEGTQTKELAFTHWSTWAETDLSPGKVENDPDVDRQGPISVAVAVTADPDSSAPGGEKTRMIIFGDADFARNRHFGQSAGGLLLVNAIKWLAEGGEDKLSIPPKQPKPNPIILTDQGKAVLWLSVFVFPFAVALSGFVIMLRRGYETYSAGFATWLIYSFLGAAAVYFRLGVVGVSEGSIPWGEGFLFLALASVAAAYGLNRRHPLSWTAAVVLAVANVGIGFVVIPWEAGQLVCAGLFVANACILIWIKRDFAPVGRGE